MPDKHKIKLNRKFYRSYFKPFRSISQCSIKSRSFRNFFTILQSIIQIEGISPPM
jgi:hypothetical protein